MKALLTPKTIALVVLLLAGAIGIWYALAVQPGQEKLDTTYTFT